MIFYHLNKFLIYLFFLFPLYIFLDFKLINIVLVCLFILNFKNYKVTNFGFDNILIPVIILISYIFSYFNGNIGIDRLMKYLYFILLPLTMQEILTKKYVSNYKIGFTFIVSIFILDVFILFKLEHQHYFSEDLIKVYLTKFNMHSTYISMLNIISLLICKNNIKIETIKIYRYFNISLFLLFSLFPFILFSKVSIIITILVIISIYFYKLIPSAKNQKIILTFFLFLIFFLTIFLYEKCNFSFNSFSLRKEIYSCSKVLIIKKTIIGYGINDAQIALNSCLHSGLKHIFSEENYNCHNQFLQFYLYSGIIGFLLYLYFFLNLICKYRFYIYNFVLIFFTYSITESILERFVGIIIFITFLNYFKSLDFE